MDGEDRTLAHSAMKGSRAHRARRKKSQTADHSPDTPVDHGTLEKTLPSTPRDEPEASELFGPDDLYDPEPDDEAIKEGGDVDFYKIVDADAEIQHNARDLLSTDDHDMVAMMDVLQCLGVDPADACRFTSSLIKDSSRCQKLFDRLSPPSGFVGAVTGHRPTFMEVYGRGSVVDASHGIRRNLNVNGLHALNLRTCKQDGSC